MAYMYILPGEQVTKSMVKIEHSKLNVHYTRYKFVFNRRVTAISILCQYMVYTDTHKYMHDVYIYIYATVATSKLKQSNDSSNYAISLATLPNLERKYLCGDWTPPTPACHEQFRALFSISI